MYWKLTFLWRIYFDMHRAVCHEYLSFIDLYNCNSAFFNDLRLDCSQACEVCCIRKSLQKIIFPGIY